MFQDALAFTAAETGFPTRLIEKDYFCTIALAYLSRRAETMAFKGGTCLAKVHADFYRLSEDLDFGISTPVDANKAQRSKLAAGPKAVVQDIRTTIPALTLRTPLAGAASSTQYLGELAYVSLVDGHEEPIKIEVSLREPFLESVALYPAHTLLLNPVNGKGAVSPVEIPCISLREAMAEKLRASMTRREPAIRDFYDIDHAVRLRGLDRCDPALLALVRRKLAMPGNGPVDLSPERLAMLHSQVEPVLGPVLRPDDFAAFDLKRSFALAQDVAKALQ